MKHPTDEQRRARITVALSKASMWLTARTVQTKTGLNTGTVERMLAAMEADGSIVSRFDKEKNAKRYALKSREKSVSWEHFNAHVLRLHNINPLDWVG